jgi:hypothetical protein
MRDRTETIFEGLKNGLDAEQIDNSLRRESMSFGERTEKNFVKCLRIHFDWLLKSIVKGTKQDDHDGIDFWLSFNKNYEFPWLNNLRLPAQVKSSPEEVDKYRNESSYIELGKKVIVINANPRLSGTAFKKQVRLELKRIHRLLTNDEEIIHS